MGKSRSGPISDKYYSDKIRHKRCIREFKQSEIHSYSITSYMTRYSRKIIPICGNHGDQNVDVEEVSNYKLMVVIIILI